jgi:NADH-ubiquinone oxidoreductase chain 4L
MLVISSFSFNDLIGQTFGIYIIAIAGAESAIGLGILGQRKFVYLKIP